MSPENSLKTVEGKSERVKEEAEDDRYSSLTPPNSPFKQKDGAEASAAQETESSAEPCSSAIDDTRRRFVGVEDDCVLALKKASIVEQGLKEVDALVHNITDVRRRMKQNIDAIREKTEQRNKLNELINEKTKENVLLGSELIRLALEEEAKMGELESFNSEMNAELSNARSGYASLKDHFGIMEQQMGLMTKTFEKVQLED